MSKGATILATLLLVAFPSTAQNAQPIPSVRVPDAATAVAIAEPALDKIYEKKVIDYEKPLTATLENGVWYVYGTLCCLDQHSQRDCEPGKCVGGVAELKVRQRDGKILSVIHTK